MSVRHKKSDLFTSDAKIIAHGCNCRGAMGSGVAAIVRRKYPDAYYDYVDEHALNGLTLGEVQFVEVEKGKYIANCMTQDDFGTHQRQVDYEAVYTCFEQLRDFALEKGIKDIAMPQIGCGLASGDWNIVLAMLESVFPEDCGVLVTYHTID